MDLDPKYRRLVLLEIINPSSKRALRGKANDVKQYLRSSQVIAASLHRTRFKLKSSTGQLQEQRNEPMTDQLLPQSLSMNPNY